MIVATLTEVDLTPPGLPPNISLDMDDYDYIRELGDRIASLTLKQAEELNRFLEWKKRGYA